MGIPSFYRWLNERYPLAIVDVVEDPPTVVNGVSVPLDCSRPNPNDIEFDNLYLDMNGIIHPCFHPEGLPAPETYDEVFDAVFKYIDRIFSIVRPRKLLYMAIDGVAPRAKMNQQRSRRFRAAKDAADEAAAKIESSREVMESGGQHLEPTKKLDSNVITPGTEFMSLLSSALQYYVHLRMNMDPGWRNIKVILSDANVPGEGEHKIMSYIRLQRNLPGFDANTRHCLYGLDADLIMLALATHEIHFTILREDVRKVYTKDRWSTDKSQKRKWENEQGEAAVKNIEEYITSLYYQFLHIWILRDYLVHDLSIPDPTVTTDLERLIDDFVFMCIFVGNDFLPHIPSLEISEGAIDLLMLVYKEEFARMGGYLTNSFEVNLGRVEHFVKAVSSHENAIFRKRSQVQKELRVRFGDPSGGRGVKNVQNSINLDQPGVKKVQSSINHVTDVGNRAKDKVKLGEEGWKERYYTEKFEANTDDDREKIRGHSVLKYIEGICWVMHYYYQGVCSWQWFYPYHYAPFASDFYGLDQLEIHFVIGKPFKPFDQLMGVLPAASAHALPFFYQKLMTDSSSPILDFYPNDFELDMNGKRFLWQAVCKLPFIKESRLLLEIAKVEHTLTDEEKRRNSLGLDLLCIHKSHPLSIKIFSFWERNKDNPKLSKAKVKRKINPEVSGGMNGYIYISDEPMCPSEINPPTDAMAMITDNKVMSVFYKYPCFHPHIPKPPAGVNVPVKFVRKQDVLPPPVLWHDRRSVRGRIYSERPIPNSISGTRLEKLAHRLVCKYYLAKQPGRGCMEIGTDIVVDALACQPKLKVPVTMKERGPGGGQFIVVEKTKKKWKQGSGSQESVSIGVSDLASQSNLKAEVSGNELDAGTGNCGVVAKQPGSPGCMEVGTDVVVDALACQPKLKVPVTMKERGPGGGQFIVVEKTKKKRKRGSGSKESVSIGVSDLASQTNLKAEVSGNELDAGTGNCVVAKQPGSQGCMEVGTDVVVDALAWQPKLKVPVTMKERGPGGGQFIVVEKTKKKRKRGSGSQESVSIGVSDLASQTNLKAEVSGNELDAGTGNGVVAKQPGSQGCMEVGTDVIVDALACQPKLKVPVTMKERGPDGGQFIVVEKTKKKRKRGSGSQESVSIGVHDLASQSNLKAEVSGKELDAGTGNCIVVEQEKKETEKRHRRIKEEN